MKQFLTAAFILTSMLAASRVNAQSKIGYVSMEELINVMPEYAKADTNLQQYRLALIQSAQDKQNALENAIEKFNKDSATMSSAVKDVKRTDLQKMLTELQGEEKRIQDQLQQRQGELLQPIQKKAFEGIQAVAKESGYTYIMDKQALFVAPPGDDILPLVAKKLNIKLPAPGAQKPAAQHAPSK